MHCSGVRPLGGGDGVFVFFIVPALQRVNTTIGKRDRAILCERETSDEQRFGSLLIGSTTPQNLNFFNIPLSLASWTHQWSHTSLDEPKFLNCLPKSLDAAVRLHEV